MKRMLAGFIDFWKIVVVDPLLSGESFFNWFDLGVLLGGASLLGIVGLVVIGIAKIFS